LLVDGCKLLVYLWPATNNQKPATFMSDPLHWLLTRRSVKARDMRDPGPNKAELSLILGAATRVPDHGKLAPWRIRILHKDGQMDLGDVMAQRFKRLNPDASEKQIEYERERPRWAPLLLVVLYTPVIGKIPEWEQQLSCGAVCMNILHAANALNYSANWLTDWPAYDDEVKNALGCRPEDKIAGFIYIGYHPEKPEDRPRPDLDEVTAVWEWSK
jgi:nitroreductase